MKLSKKKFFPTPLRVVFHSSELCLVVDQGKEKKKKSTRGTLSIFHISFFRRGTRNSTERREKN